MPIDPPNAAPGNRINFAGVEYDVIDRVSGESGNRYVLLADTVHTYDSLAVFNEAYVIEHAESSHVSTTAQAKDPEVAAAAAEAESKEEELNEFRAWKAEQDAAAPAPTDPTAPTENPGATTPTTTV